MILIKSIDWIETDMDRAQVMTRDPDYKVIFGDGQDGAPDVMDLTIAQETVMGREFIDSRGRSIFLGMTSKASEALGVQYEVLENLSRDLANEREEGFKRGAIIRDQSAAIKVLKSAKWYTRLAWLFKGVPQ